MLSRSIGKAISKHLQTANGDNERGLIGTVAFQQRFVILMEEKIKKGSVVIFWPLRKRAKIKAMTLIERWYLGNHGEEEQWVNGVSL